MSRPCEGEAYVFSKVVQVSRDVAEVQTNYTRIAKTDPTIALRSNQSCLSQIIWSGLGKGDAALDKVIIVGGH